MINPQAIIQAAQNLMPKEEPKKRHLRFSAVQQWLRCRKAHHFSYVEGIEPMQSNKRMDLGSAIHKGFEAFWRGQNIDEQIDLYISGITARTDEERAENQEMGALAKRLVKRGLEWMNADEYEVVALDGVPLIEFSLDVPIEGFDSFGGTVDIVLREKATGAQWLVDYKSKKTFDGEDADRHNLQFATYQQLLALKGVDVVGSKMFEILTEEPKEPKVNKDGTVSRAACNTTWEIYKSVVERHGGNPTDYADVEAKLKDKVFFKFVDTYRSPEHVKAVYENIIVPAAREMAAEPTPIPVMNKFVCKSCSFEQLCMAQLHPDADPEWIRDTQYKKRGLPVLEMETNSGN